MTFQSIPLVPEGQPQQAAAQAEPTKAAQAPNAVLDKDIIKEMAGKGVMNDVLEYKEEVENAYNTYAGLTDVQKNTTFGRKLRSTMQGDIGRLNSLQRLGLDFDAAKKTVESNGANDEIAVTNRGMIVKDMSTGDISEIDPSKFVTMYKENKNLKPLTNSQLIEEREYNKKLAFQTKPIEVLKNAKGMEKIKSEIWGILGHIGSTTVESSGNRMIDASNEETAKALNSLVGMAREGVYDVSQMQSKETNHDQLQAAATAMWTNMSESARSVLKARAAIRGEENVEKAAMEDMVSLLSPYSKTTNKSSLKTEYAKDATEATQGTKTMGLYQAMANSKGTLENTTINVGNNIDFTTKSAVFPGFVDESKNPYGSTSVSNIKQLHGIADMNSISFGDKHLNPEQLEGLIYNGDKVRTSELPAKQDVDSNGRATGTISPDFDMIKTLNNAESELSKYKSTNAIVKESVYKKYNIPTDGRGNPKLNSKKFVVFGGYANASMFKDPDSKLLINMSDSDDVKNLYEKQYLYGGKDANDKNKIERSSDKYESRWGNKDIFKSQVFIPLAASNALAVILDKNELSVQNENQVISNQRTYGNVNKSKYTREGYGK